MANVTGTYTTGFKDENAIDLGLQLVETAYLTAVKANMVPNYILPDAQVSKFFFKSGVTTYNLDDIYVRADFWRQGNLLNWGNNAQGQLGTHDITRRSSPVQTCAGGNNWNDCSRGGQRIGAGIKTDGTLWTWGQNAYGGLGDNTITHRSSPVQTVTGGTNWQQVACANSHAAAIKTDGTLWTWGQNAYGGLGDNTITSRSSPVQTVAGGSNWKQVSCGGNSTAAIKTDGTLWVWGKNSQGELGDNTITSRSSPVQTVAGGSNWKSVSFKNGSAGIKTDGTLWLWGPNSNGQLGDNTVVAKSSPVQTVSGGTNWKKASTGGAIKTDGSLWLWGSNYSGKLGDNTITHRSSPVQTISSGNNWLEVSCGVNHAAAIKTDGTLWLWGYNSYGSALGDNTNVARSSPVQTVLGGTSWRKVDVGDYQTIALNYLGFPAGTIPDPPPGPAPTPAPAPCWVARLVYGELNPRWMVFRDWLLNEAPLWFKNLYISCGESFASYIKDMPLAKSIVKSMMDIIVRKRYKK
jgi:alpha-tubulin suppressor-like RCC1 family protein